MRAIDDELVTAIVDELRDDQGSLKDYRHPETRSVPLKAHARAEVHRSLARLRMLEEGVVPAQRVPSATDLREAKRALSKVLIDDRTRAAYEFLKGIKIEPPPKFDAKKWRCAAEAFDLFELFSHKFPSHTGRSNREWGAFQAVASLLYEGVYNAPEANLQRACAAVLRARRAVLRGVPRDPTTGAPTG
jgi:hypothetical protein